MTDQREPDEIDPEIAEIFVEEATEVIETLETHFPLWQQTPAEGESLAEIRRAFHTLKGSGRMVGAETVGDLAWSIENLLNRVSESTVAVSPPVIEAVDRACQMLPGLVDAFATRAPVDLRAVSGLQEVADALSRNEAVEFPEAATEVAEALSEAEIEQAARELVPEPEELEAPEAEAPVPEFEPVEAEEAEAEDLEPLAEESADWLSKVLAEEPASQSREAAEAEPEAAAPEETADWLSRQIAEEIGQEASGIGEEEPAAQEEVESWLSELMPEGPGEEAREGSREDALEQAREEPVERPVEAESVLPAEDLAEEPGSAAAEWITGAAEEPAAAESVAEHPEEFAEVAWEEPEEAPAPERETPALDVAARVSEAEPAVERAGAARHAEELAWTRAVQDLARRRAVEMQQMRRTRLKLLAILLTPLLVFALATLVFYTGIGIPKATTNHGELLYPPLHMDDVSWRDDSGAPWTYSGAEPGWSLMVVGRGDCGEACRERLFLTRQIRTALGKDAGRVSRYFLNLDPVQAEDFSRYIAAEQPDLHVLHADTTRLGAWLGKPGGFEPADDHLILLVDPLGYLMMYYTTAHTGRDTIDDMRFLLKHSYENLR
jgi:HPt (histidine-containing phosphotransfer) domain-containing protein